MKNPLSNWLCCLLLWLVPLAAHAQMNSGSNGSDGAFNPTTNIVINMADHPNGIYQYTSVNIPSGVTVTFIPNANNTPVVWLAQVDVVINGSVNVNGQSATDTRGVSGGPGGFKGGEAQNGNSEPTGGQGPGGGTLAHGASYEYGNSFLIPLLGGSGGSGSINTRGGSGGGGAILIAASDSGTSENCFSELG